MLYTPRKVKGADTKNATLVSVKKIVSSSLHRVHADMSSVSSRPILVKLNLGIKSESGELSHLESETFLIRAQ